MKLTGYRFRLYWFVHFRTVRFETNPFKTKRLLIQVVAPTINRRLT